MLDHDRTFDTGDYSSDKVDSKLPISFLSKRHTEPISGPDTEFQTWRMKERMKTVSVALVLCLNVGVDPPDIVKTQPCARLECWIDPQSMSGQKALENIGASLQKQYERWQPRARYKQSLDPTAEEVKKLCTSLRRNAKEERVLFHYNGHGVPKPTANGEIWVFNRSYTQYIPLSVFDLQSWMGAPSIYVYDCSNAGMIVDSFKNFADQHEKEYENMSSLAKTLGENVIHTVPHCFKNCIQLAACSSTQILPMNPDLPADLFTSCLTTPIKIALTWYMMQSSATLIPRVTMEHIEKIPGQLNDRRTMLGELNWIFTAITDTIAWNTLPKELFQKLFRQDLLVASLFRNFLLAERIMRSFDCTPVSSPKLPTTHQHPMWLAWDWALDGCLLQLPAILEGEQTFTHSTFFEEQLTAFEVWLLLGSEKRKPPEQLPVVLQVLLSQVHRLRALELLGRFLDLGPWAVNLALSVGIFPYVLKLLQSSARELRPLLVFIWAKILAVDSTCQADLVRDNGHKYFLSVLQDTSMSSEDRTLAAFVLATIVHEYPQGQEVALQGSLVSICLVQLADPNPLLRQWLAICLGRLWTGLEKARWCGVRDNAHEKLYHLLEDPCPEVRAAAVFALGTFVSSVVERSEHANNIDQSVAMNLLNTSARDMSVLVRKELVAALQWMVLLFETSFLSVALQEEGRVRDGSNMVLVSIPTEVLLSPATGLRRNPSRDRLRMLSPGGMTNADGTATGDVALDRIKRVSSSSSLSSPGGVTALPNIAYGSVYMKLWSGLTTLDNDPHPAVASLARTVTDYIRDQIKECATSKDMTEWSTRISSSVSLPPSPSSRPTFLSGESPPTSGSTTDLHRIASRSTHSFSKSRKNVPITISEETDDGVGHRKPLVNTNFVEWSSKFFSKPVNRILKNDVGAEVDYEREWRFSRNASKRAAAAEERRRLPTCRLENQVFTTRVTGQSSLLLMYPYQPLVAVAYGDTISLWDYVNNNKAAQVVNDSSLKEKRVTTMDLINPHDKPLLMVGSNDGTLRLWSHEGIGAACGTASGFGLVTAWQALADAPPATKVLNSTSGSVACWEQQSETIAVSGDVKVVRIWDATSEMKVHDIRTDAEYCVTSISCDGHLVAAGYADGSVRVFDRRTDDSDVRAYTWREHAGWIVNCTLKGNTVTSGSVMGDIRFFDLRRSSAVTSCHTSHGMTAMAVHREADIFACGSVHHLIGVYSCQGLLLSSIKYHEGFMGARIAPVSCLAFHPHRPVLAAGSVDYSVSVYSVDPKR